MIGLLSFWAEWLPSLLDGLKVSVEVTSVGLLFGVPLGLLLALGVQARSPLPHWLALGVVEVGRGAPVLILLQFAYFGLPSAGLSLSSFTAASFAFAWCTGAYTSEIIRAGLEAVPHGQKEAAAAIGFTRLDELRFVILPQGLRVALPALLGFAILMLQASSLCFAIALPELVSQAYAIGSTTFAYMPILVLAGLLYAAICIPATLLVAGLERRLGRHAA
ncbi:amino acid ABC transporter permease [Lichenibacterium dinghuense]|uniref:amino acid ABC transporter permease n=1 Tax=Lichenibacterium dinghuense TaxID=2895977 RepID=UPI001F3D1FCF|nr:amino acid ABC transporter permease [Lichenibacterium sp. 6Y81]